MIYKFKAEVPIADTSSLITPDGSIEVSATIQVFVPVEVNTELPDDAVESLTANVSTYLSTVTGSTVTAELFSKEQ